MAAPASEELRELERELLLAAERGESMTRAAVQEQFGCAATEAQGMLDRLREHGKAVEFAPGEWHGPTLDEVGHAAADPPRVVVDVESDDGDGLGAPREQRAPRSTVAAGMVDQPTVRLTRSIAEALGDVALGQLVKAGLGDVEIGDVFVLEVTP